ncbi:MAG: hypothetical protein ACW99Q_10470, partial [Candidatus Kariarchaeaceae archaeon]
SILDNYVLNKTFMIIFLYNCSINKISLSATPYLMSPSLSLFVFNNKDAVNIGLVHIEPCVFLLLILLESSKSAFP